MSILPTRLQNTEGLEPSQHLPGGWIQSLRESVQMCPGDCGERRASLRPAEVEEGDKEKSWKGLGERPSACSPDRHNWVESSAWGFSVGFLVAGGGMTTIRKENLGDTAVIRSGDSLPISDPTLSLIQPLQLSQPLLQSPKLSQCSGIVSWASWPFLLF